MRNVGLKSSGRGSLAAANDRQSGPYRCEVVQGADVDRAIGVRQRVYVDEFGFDLAVRDEMDDRAVQLLATDQAGTAVGSLRLLDATARPFEVEGFLRIDPYVDEGRHPAEITRLCILEPHRYIAGAAPVHLVMFEAVLRLTRRLRVTDLVASTRSDLAAFYKYLLFDMYPKAVYHHPEIDHAAHVLMILDLTTIAQRYKKHRPALHDALGTIIT